MSLPEIQERAGNYIFTWGEEQVQITASRAHQHRDGRVTSELLITTTNQDYHPHLLRKSVNLLATRSLAELAKSLSERYNKIAWPAILEQLSEKLLARIRQGEPVQELWTTEPVVKPKYLVHPFLPLNQTAILFGDKGTAKSYFALYLAILSILKIDKSIFNLEYSDDLIIPLYLDWETDRSTILYREQAIQRGFTDMAFSLNYRRCLLPLADDLEEIKNIMSDKKVNLVIVDSLGPACGGNLNEAESSIRFLQAVRTLDSTTLIIAHTSKSQEQTKTVFGSAFFKFLARSIWETRSHQEAYSSELSVALFHRNANNSKLFYPIGFRMEFDEEEDKVSFHKEDVTSKETFLAQMSLTTRITECLKAGSMSVKDIADETDSSTTVTSVALSRMRKRGLVVKLGNKWGLTAIEQDF